MTLVAASAPNSSDYNGLGVSEDAAEVRSAFDDVFAESVRDRVLPPHLAAMSPYAVNEVEARWGSRVARAMFEYLAEIFPAELLRLIALGVLTPPQLTHAAEAAGKINRTIPVKETLLPLLDHSSAIVREGAIYGLSYHADDAVRARIAEIARSDNVPEIRQAAEDTLADL